MSFSHAVTELTGITAATLSDEQALAALAIAAAGAIGLNAHGPPTIRSGPQGIAVGLLGHGGHVVLHALPASGACLVDVVTPHGAPPSRAVHVIARRLGVNAPA
ncbi:MAG TPA: S-adenosylmethionine decarboxylase [Gemmatimonadales bacterium]|jgi:S-adenosylmethionine/arginine decarboxylase-like enzyme